MYTLWSAATNKNICQCGCRSSNGHPQLFWQAQVFLGCENDAAVKILNTCSLWESGQAIQEQHRIFGIVGGEVGVQDLLGQGTLKFSHPQYHSSHAVFGCDDPLVGALYGTAAHRILIPCLSRA